MNTVTQPNDSSRTDAGIAESDRDRLAAALRQSIRGEVRFDDGSRALYATDSSNYRQTPIGVVIPRDINDVVQTVALCHEHGAPILSRGGGTSLAGQCCNVAVVIDFSKYLNQVCDLNSDERTARVEPGTVLDDLRNAAEQYNLTFGPDPATHNHCTLGGMIGNNSCGVHSIMAGKTDDNIESMEILTYDGLRMTVGPTSDQELEQIIAGGGRRSEIYRRLKALRDRYADLIREQFPNIPRRVSGYNLDQLLPENGFNVAGALVGSEGTCVTILEATARLVESPPARSLVVLGYPSAADGADDVPKIMQHGPIGLEAFDDRLTRAMERVDLLPENRELLPDGGGWLLVEFGANAKEDADDKARQLMDDLKQADNSATMKLLTDPDETAMVWQVRESALGATAQAPGIPDAWPGWEDSAVPPERLGDYLRDLRSLLDSYGYRGSFYGHFGQGCIHTRIDFDLTSAAGIQAFRSFMEEASDLALSYGGSLSGEHGDGQSRAELLPKMFGSELIDAFREFKTIWDPKGKMNPGKVVDPYPLDSNLRLGVDYAPKRVQTHFQFPDDEGSFADATLRCVGVGKCRRHDAGTMCPSYMVTREEMHSTRGRARLLFEMLQGETIDQSWRNESVKEALDLCLACKGCKGDCPVQVDMATYKAEFLSHYYAGHRRPMAAYSMGLIYWWARLASHAPGIVNTLGRLPVVGNLGKRAAGIAPQRQLPIFAEQTFKQWFAAREPRQVDSPKVILWADTFNNHFHPDTAAAAVDVLEVAGFQVQVPEQALCCGRPLYDWGMLDLAKRLLRQILDTLRDEIRDGTPLVVLEPSCAAVFRDELRNLFPHDEDAKRLYRQTYLLSEFLTKQADDFELPELDRKALVHGHCHHKAIMGMQTEESVLGQLGLDFEVLDSGCCGMAGSFGFERGERYDVSIAVGERVLLPAVRAADDDTLIIADGFSCREQIRQETGREPLHLAQVLQMAIQGRSAPAAFDSMTPTKSSKAAWGVIRVVTGVLAGALIWFWKGRRSR